MSESIPKGYCQCGCGQKTKIWQGNDKYKGRVKGEPAKYIFGHSLRSPSDEPKYRIDSKTGCWVWLGSLSRGYARMWLKDERRTMAVHRFHYERKYGPVPNGLDLDHLCRNRACVNPDHCEPVTRLINITRGSASKLTWEKVRVIRARRQATAETMKTIADDYGVDEATISYILAGKTWKEES